MGSSNIELTLPDAALNYLEWLIDGGKGKRAKAAELGVSYEQLRRWEADPRFSEERERRLAGGAAMSPEHVQKLASKMFEEGLKGDVQASKLFLDLTKLVNPTSLAVVDRGLPELSNAELQVLWDEGRVP